MKSLRWMVVPVLAVSVVSCGSDSGGGSTAAWCDLAKGIEDQFDSIGDAFGSAPAEIEALFDDITTELEAAVDAAPSEIADQVKMTQDAIAEMKGVLADADYNILDVDQAALAEVMANEDMETAGDEIQAFNEKECGIVADSTVAEESTDDTLPAASGTARDQIAESLVGIGLTEDEAACVADNIDPELAEQVGTDPTAMMGVFETCNIGLDRLAELGQGG